MFGYFKTLVSDLSPIKLDSNKNKAEKSSELI